MAVSPREEGMYFSPGPSRVNSLVIYLAAPASLITAHNLLGVVGSARVP